MSANIERPNKIVAKEILRNVNKILSELNAVVSSDLQFKRIIEREANAFCHSSALHEMSVMAVETLNADKKGIRISALKNAGIANLSQLYGKSINSLMCINGIGEQTAIRIKRLVDEMYNAVISSAVRINLKNKNPHQDALLSALFIFRNTEYLRSQAQDLLCAEPNLSGALRKAKTVVSKLRWLFSFKGTKKSAVEAFSYISNLSNGSFLKEATQCVTEYENIVKTSLDLIINDFEKSLLCITHF